MNKRIQTKNNGNDLLTKSFKLEVKEIDDNGTFVGFASTYGNIDLQGDVVEKGAFSRTLQHKSGKVVLLWQHRTDEPIGIGELEDSNVGLKIKGKLNLEVARGREAYALLKQGAISGLSIGYDVIKDTWKDGVRYLKELRLWEVSVVTFPANPVAGVAGVKSNIPFADLPLAEVDTKWNAKEAVQRLKKHATDDNGELNFGVYAKGFLWYNKNGEGNFENYIFPIADVIDGELKAIPKGIYTAAAIIHGSKGIEVPSDEIPNIKSHIEKYYKKLGKDAPWGKDFKAYDLMQTIDEDNKRQAFWKLQDALYSTLHDIMHSEELQDDEKLIALELSLTQFKDAMMDVGMTLINSGSKGTEPDEGKAGRVISSSNLNKLKSTLEALGNASSLLQALLEAAEPKADPGNDSDDDEGAKGLGDTINDIINQMKSMGTKS